MNTKTTFKVGDRVKQYATHPDRDYVGFVEYVALSTTPPEYRVRWHGGYASWEIETDLEKAPEAAP